jgi:hypothetical protein
MGSFKKENCVRALFILAAFGAVIYSLFFLWSNIAHVFEPIGTKPSWFATPEAILGFCLLVILLIIGSAVYWIFSLCKIYKESSPEEKKSVEELARKTGAFILRRLSQRKDKIGKTAKTAREFSEEVLGQQ